MTHTATGTICCKSSELLPNTSGRRCKRGSREGIARAGKYKGRAKTAMAKAGEVAKLLSAGVGPAEVARKLGIGRSSVYRAIRERGIKRQSRQPA